MSGTPKFSTPGASGRNDPQEETPARPPVPLLPEDVEYWLEQFGGAAKLEEWIKEQAKGEGGRRKGESKK